MILTFKQIFTLLIASFHPAHRRFTDLLKSKAASEKRLKRE